MATFKVTGKVRKPELGTAGTVTASKVIDAANESDAKSKAIEKWQITYGEILNNGREIEDITIKSL